LKDNLKALLIKTHDDTGSFPQANSFSIDKVDWHEVTSASQAIDILTQSAFDLVIIDCQFFDRKAIQICQQIRARQNESFTSIVYLSEASSLKERLKAYEAGADDYIHKPISQAELNVKLQACINYQQKHKEIIQTYELQTLASLQARFNEDSDTSTLLALYKTCITTQSVEQLAHELEKILIQFQLSFSLQINTELGLYHLKDNGTDFSPIENDLFTTLKANGVSIQNFGHKSYFQNGEVELIIHNMPINDIELYGRLKDLLHLIIGVISDKNKILNILLVARKKCNEAINDAAEGNIEHTSKKLIELQNIIGIATIAEDDNMEDDFIFF